MAVAGQVGEVLPDRAAVAQVMVTGEEAGESWVGSMLGVKQFERDWGEFSQACGDGCREVVESGEFARRGSTPCRFSSGGREGDHAAPVHFEQEGVGSHVFEPPGLRAPVPSTRDFLGETTTMPVRMGGDQLQDLGEVLLGETAALNSKRSVHKAKGNKEDGGKSSGEFLLATTSELFVNFSGYGMGI
jgi:hypothetical protein